MLKVSNMTLTDSLFFIILSLSKRLTFSASWFLHPDITAFILTKVDDP